VSVLIEFLEDDVAGLIEPNMVKKHSGEKPHAKEIHTHNTNSESTVFHCAATPLNIYCMHLFIEFAETSSWVIDEAVDVLVIATPFVWLFRNVAR
jgi:hypothetical protein